MPKIRKGMRIKAKGPDQPSEALIPLEANNYFAHTIITKIYGISDKL